MPANMQKMSKIILVVVFSLFNITLQTIKFIENSMFAILNV